MTQARLALFLPTLGGGGAERVLVNLATAIAARGIPIDLVLGSLGTRAYMDQIPPTLNLVNLEIPRVAFGLPKLVRYLRRAKPAALLSTTFHANCLAVAAGRIARSPTRVIVRVENTMSITLGSERPLRRMFYRRCIRYCYPRASRVVAVSNGVADDLQDRMGVPRGMVTVLYSPIINADLIQKAKQRPDHPWLDPNQPPVILSVGSLRKAKQHETLIRAFAIVRQKVHSRLLLLGEGERRAELESLVAQLGLTDDVSMPGFVVNPFAFMAKARVFVLSSAWEGLPGALIQAMACGCPVISTDCPSGPREVLRDGRLGTLVPVGDVAAMSEAILGELDGVRRSPASEEDLKPFSEEEATRAYLNVLLTAP